MQSGLVFFTQCNNETFFKDLKWRTFVAKEAGVKVDFPCEPKKDFKSFQEKPRPINIYGISCQVDGIRFLVSSKNYLDDFNENSIPNYFESIESNNKVIFGAVKNLDEKDISKYPNVKGKFYKLELESKGIIYILALADENRTYEIMAGLLPEKDSSENVENEFDIIAKKFIDSFEIIQPKN
ncbi:MAG: hypothetical protein M3405_00510 [Acidobacteriota bacterium]|jgi:hypothetical protein|nr:hypothetical protein [Acidobacteriota bacterium]